MSKVSFTAVIALCCLLVIGFAGTTKAQQANTLRSTEGHFVMAIPSGWQQVAVAGMQYPVLTDPKPNAFSPYIQINTVPTPMPLSEFVANNKKQYKKTVPDGAILEEKPFVTDKGLRGVRLVAKGNVGGKDLQAVYYLFKGPNNTIYSIMANSDAAGFQANAPIFDDAIKSLVVE